jgi:Flp pilus assembly protein TadD
MHEPLATSSTSALGVSLALHALNAALVYALTATLSRRAGERGNVLRHLSAAVVAFLFAAHPLRVEAVAGADGPWLLAGAGGVLLGVLLFVKGAHTRRPWRWRLASLAGFGGGLTLAWAGHTAGEPTTLQPMEHLARAAWNAVFFVWKTAWPADLSPIYELHTPLKWTTPPFIAALVGVGVALAGGLLLLRRARGAAVAAFAYLACAPPAAALLGSGLELTADRFSYLPAATISVALGVFIVWLWQRTDDTSRVWAGTLLVGTLAFVVWLGPQTWRYAQVWRDPLTLWKYAVAHQPRGQPWSGVALYRLGCVHAAIGQPEAAEQNLRLAVQQRPTLTDARLRLAEVQLELMQTDAAVATLRQAAATAPRRAEVHFRLGAALAAAGALDDAADALRQAVALDARHVAAHAALGRVLLLRGEPAAALAEFKTAVGLSPTDAELYYDLGRAHRAVGDSAQARAAFELALKRDPEHGPARRALGELSRPTSRPQQ